MAVREVQYNGFRFRSQIEARTAMVFDALGVEYMYEPDCYDLAHGKRRFGYYPDFLLPQHQRFLEIKNMGTTPPTPDECLKAKLLAEQNANGYPVTILYGSIGNYIRHGSGRTYWPDGNITMPDVLTQCKGGRTQPPTEGHQRY